MAKTNEWYEVKVVRENHNGTRFDGWIAFGSSGVFFWQREFRNEATPVACRFACFEKAEKMIDEFLATRGLLEVFYEVHFPIRRDSLGRKRPLKRRDCEIVKSA